MNAPLTTATLQRGLNGYAGVGRHVPEQHWSTTIAYGASKPIYLAGIDIHAAGALCRVPVGRGVGAEWGDDPVFHARAIDKRKLIRLRGATERAAEAVDRSAGDLAQQSDRHSVERGGRGRVRQRLLWRPPDVYRGGQLQSGLDDVRRDAATAAMVERRRGALGGRLSESVPGGRK